MSVGVLVKAHLGTGGTAHQRSPATSRPLRPRAIDRRGPWTPRPLPPPHLTTTPLSTPTHTHRNGGEPPAAMDGSGHGVNEKWRASGLRSRPWCLLNSKEGAQREERVRVGRGMRQNVCAGWMHGERRGGKVSRAYHANASCVLSGLGGGARISMSM